MKHREGTLSLATGDIVLTKDDTRRLWPEGFYVKMGPLDMDERDIFAHKAFADKLALQTKLGPYQKTAPKKMM